MSENTEQVVWLTPEARDKLTEELEYLKGEGRQVVSARIASAREEGDLKENGGYHAAREEQGQQELRIRQLEDMLRKAQVGEAPAGGGKVSPGSQVTVAFDGDQSDTDTFVLGSRELLGLDERMDVNVYSPQSPLGTAILGKRKGDDASYQTPNGKSVNVTIMAIEAYSG